MLAAAGSLGEQLRAGFELGTSAPGLPDGDGITSVVVCGMGGSGITGDVLQAALADAAPVPVIASKGYGVPSFLGQDSLVLAVSYSGNTEETTTAFEAAVARGARVIAVASGGELLSRAADRQVAASVRIPPDAIAPRAALGYLVGAALGAVAAVGLCDVERLRDELDQAAGRLRTAIDRLGPAAPSEKNEAKRLATWLRDATPLVWGTEGIGETAARRWKTQLNENAKTPAFGGALPELDHNEVEGWSGGGADGYRAVVLRSRFEPDAMAHRVPATLEAMASVGLEAREVWGDGESALEQLCGLIMTGDYVSIYLAILRGVDPTPIPLLSALKSRRQALKGQQAT